MAKRRASQVSYTEAARIGAERAKRNREAAIPAVEITDADRAAAVDEMHAGELYAASNARSAALSAVLKLRAQLEAAEARMHAASDDLFAVADRLARLPRDCQARRSARAIWPHWQYDHAVRHGKPVANDLPDDIKAIR